MMTKEKMNRVHVLHALAESIGNRLVVEDIESAGGRLTSERLEDLEAILVKNVVALRFSENWPPKLK